MTVKSYTLKRTLLLLLILLHQKVFTQPAYWQQKVQYNIEVKLDDKSNMLTANMQMLYFNNSPDTLQFLWIHLWPNAYNKNSALAQQLGAGLAAGRDRQGFIDQLDFRHNGKELITSPHPQHNDILKVTLDQPLLPGDSIELTTPFRVKLPVFFSRSGHFANQYLIAQWYPKPAVYDRKGWHPMPYLELGEFYSEIGSFNVIIEIPAAYVVAATGELRTRDEYDMYKKIGIKNNMRETRTTRYSRETGGNKRLQFQADSVHDFAWFADKNFIIRYDTLRIDDRIIDVFSYAKNNGNENWKQSILFLKDVVRKYSEWIGPYPYPAVAAVEGPANDRIAGMEYPMITLITRAEATERELDGLFAHEVGHNWFYGILASNERLHPWMDEGMNCFFQFRYEAEKYRWNSFVKNISDHIVSANADEFLFHVLFQINKWPLRSPVETPASAFSNMRAYASIVYLKAAVWMGLLEASLGKENFRHAIRVYYSQWKFRHPYPEDFRQSIEHTLQRSLGDLFELLNKKGTFN